MTPRAFVTLHDVAPASLDDCISTLEALRARHVDRVTLLVVPGAGWAADDLDVLRGFQASGHCLAGHGWSHRAPARRTLYHRLHGAILSRDEAEHLSRSRDDLVDLVRRCFAWFQDAGLDAPSFYVPPAWAIGALRRSDRAALPFRYWESLTGLHDARHSRFRALPLVGYLADTRARARALRATNAVNLAAAKLLRRPLRISIHPPDLRLYLKDDLLGILDRDWHLVDADDLFAGGPAEPAGPISRRGRP